MIIPTATVKGMKSGFFDRPGMIERMNKARHRALWAFGGNVRQQARKLLKTRRSKWVQGPEGLVDQTQYSRPGDPPFVRSPDSLLRRFLYYAFDGSRGSVIIGPARTDKPTGAPAALEWGGVATLRVYKPGKVIGTRRWGNRSGSGTRVIRARGRLVQEQRPIAARPYMRPAFGRGLAQLRQQWKDVLHRTGDL